MRRWFPWFVVALGVAGCTRDTDPNGDSDTDAADTDAEADSGYPSSFTDGKFRMTSFVMQPVDTGADLDGDGTQDNNLPKLLTFAATAVDPQLAPAEINATIADNLATDVLITLLDAHHADLDLSIAILGGVVVAQPDTGDTDAPATIGVDPLSLDDQGKPRSIVLGQFSSETEFSASSDRIDVPAVFVPGGETLLVPIALATLSGSMNAEGSEGLLVGVAPAQPFIDQVIEPMIPPEGYDSDGDGDIEFTYEQLMTTVTSLVNNENMSDWVFEDGTRGITAAFTYTAAPASF